MINVSQKLSIGFVLHKNKDFEHVKKVTEPVYQLKAKFCPDTGIRLPDEKVIVRKSLTTYKLGDEEVDYFPDFKCILEDAINKKVGEEITNIDHFFDQCSGRHDYMVVGLKKLSFNWLDLSCDYDTLQFLKLEDIVYDIENFNILEKTLYELGFKNARKINVVNGFLIL